MAGVHAVQAARQTSAAPARDDCKVCIEEYCAAEQPAVKERGAARRQAGSTTAGVLSAFSRTCAFGSRKVVEKTEFDQKTNQAQRRTMVPAGGGRSEFAIPTCGRDALSFQYFARREMGQGRVPPAGKIF